MDFTSRQLRAFLLVAQYRSFTRAAQALYITPSGLSVLIRELETQLGFRLFDRTTRHVALTAYGNELLAVAQRSVTDLDVVMSQLKRSAIQASLSVALGAAPLISANILPQAIKEFRRHWPDIRIRLFDGSQTAILEMVETGKLDVGLGVFPPIPGIRRVPIFRFSLMLMRPEKAPVFRPASTAWAALKNETLISLPPASPIQRIVNKHLDKAHVTPREGAVVNLLDTQIALVEADEGIAIVPSFGLPACRNRRVVMSRLVNPVVHMEFYQISDRGRKLAPEADAFTAFLKSYFARWAGRAGVL